jgi:fucose 4-O-acetylase-like acetyltransferase
MSRPRLYDIDRAKGLAIFLVVLGHIVAGPSPKNNKWFNELVDLLYLFHMPFFMFLSGAIFYYTFNALSSWKDFKDYIIKKAGRIIPGFLLFSFLILIGKYTASYFLYVDDVERHLMRGVVDIFIFPARSAGGSLWYIYVLFEFYCIFPLLLKLTKGNIKIVFYFSIILHICSLFFSLSAFFLISRVFEYALYFSLGILFISYYDMVKEIITKYFMIFLTAFILSFFLIPYLTPDVNKTVIGLLSIPALFGMISLPFINKKSERPLILFGEYTLTIYLLNTITIGLAKGTLFKFWNWNGTNFIFFIPILLFAGIGIPILLYKYFFSHSAYLSKILK